jgi:Family of unknown function (DUF6390)
MSTAGARLFARYAYPPNERGYCGPSDTSLVDIAQRAAQFEGAWVYLEYLASVAGVDDPLDERVVEAYWVGNSLLAISDPADLVSVLVDRFRGQVGGTWRSASSRAVPHHTFQVFEVYPWAGLLAKTGHPQALSVLQDCRIRTGRVLKVTGESAVVRSSPLAWDGASLSIGSPREELVRWSQRGQSLIDRPSPGDTVSLHWDWLCDRLTAEQASAIASHESRYLAHSCRSHGASPVR